MIKYNENKNFLKSKPGFITIVIIVIVILSFFYALGTGQFNKSEDTDQEITTTNIDVTITTSQEINTEPNTTSKPSDSEQKYSLKTGKILDIKESDGILIIKAKITPQLTNKLIISQNYHNVEDIIKNQGGDKFTEIQYWAVADMTDGEESKVISFTVKSVVISGTSAGDIVAIQYPDLVTDLWILPSLKD